MEASEEQIAAAEGLLSALHLSAFYAPSVPNPALQRHWEVLEAFALGEEPGAAEDVRDETQPDAEAFEAVAETIQAFKVGRVGGAVSKSI